MAIKVKVNKDNCIGCGLCVGACPEVFEFDDEGKAAATAGPVTDENESSVLEAQGSCPCAAIEEE